MNWVAFISRTGSEVYNISQNLGIVPSLIVCNRPISEKDQLHKGLLEKFGDRVVFVKSKPTSEDYVQYLRGADLITLNGWLRIIPADICNRYTILNGHPGDAVNYSKELKGKDQQQHAYDLGHKTAGFMIHKAAPVVDSGFIYEFTTRSIEGLDMDGVYQVLAEAGVDSWTRFLKRYLKL